MMKKEYMEPILTVISLTADATFAVDYMSDQELIFGEDDFE